MIDLNSETILTLPQAAERFPSRVRGKTTSPKTILLYGTRGIRGVRLEMVRLGVQWLTSLEAIERFSAALTAGFANPGRDHDGPRPATVSPARRKRQEQADRELAALGV